MAIRVRRGNSADFDINKMLPGEFAVTIDTGKIYVCTNDGNVKELATVDDLKTLLDVSEEAYAALLELISMLGDETVLAGMLSDISDLKSGNYTIAFSESTNRENIENTDTVSTIFGKIKKYLTDLKTVAFTGSYNDIKDTPTLGNSSSKDVANNCTTDTPNEYVLDAYQGKALFGKIIELQSEIFKIANPSTTIESVPSGQNIACSIDISSLNASSVRAVIPYVLGGIPLSFSINGITNKTINLYVRNDTGSTLTNRTIKAFVFYN